MILPKIKLSLVLFGCINFSGLAQLKKSTLSIGGGQVDKQRHSIIYSVGQKTVTGNLISKKLSFIQGYLNPPLSKRFYNQSDLDINVYPNPFTSYFIVEFPFPVGETTASLFDINGIPIDAKIEQPDSSSLRFSDLEHFATATYLLRIDYGEIVYYRHLILDR